MSHYLALDYGERNVGIAITVDNDKKVVPLTTLDRKHQDFWHELDECIADHDISSIVVGLPLGLDGTKTDQTQRVRDFIKDLQSKYSMPIHEYDERLTSRAVENMIPASLANGEPIDHFVAAQILVEYLEKFQIPIFKSQINFNNQI